MTKQEAIDWAGGLTILLAAKLGITHGAISKWTNTVPMKQQYRLAAMSGGKLKIDEAEVAFVKGKKGKRNV